MFGKLCACEINNSIGVPAAAGCCAALKPFEVGHATVFLGTLAPICIRVGTRLEGSLCWWALNGGWHLTLPTNRGPELKKPEESLGWARWQQLCCVLVYHLQYSCSVRWLVGTYLWEGRGDLWSWDFGLTLNLTQEIKETNRFLQNFVLLLILNNN